jgi:hypothetical protein
LEFAALRRRESDRERRLDASDSDRKLRAITFVKRKQMKRYTICQAPKIGSVPRADLLDFILARVNLTALGLWPSSFCILPGWSPLPYNPTRLNFRDLRLTIVTTSDIRPQPCIPLSTNGSVCGEIVLWVCGVRDAQGRGAIPQPYVPVCAQRHTTYANRLLGLWAWQRKRTQRMATCPANGSPHP